MKKIRTVVSLFDGISCGQVALNQEGVSYQKYYASEIETYAMKITQKNFPNTNQMGDVTKWKEWDIDWSQVDLIFAGFPCQSFSNSGKKLGLSDPRGQLVFVMMDILNHCKQFNPNVKFLFENTTMKKHVLEDLNKIIGCDSVMVNSALVSAQNRKRNYWSNMTITQPDDKELVIGDILNYDESFEITNFGQYDPVQCKNYYQFDVSGKGYKSQQDRAYYTNTKFGCIPNARTITKIKIAVSSNHYRNLSLREVESLQTLPHDYTLLTDENGFSLGQSLSAIGNGWNVATIRHFLKENLT